MDGIERLSSEKLADMHIDEMLAKFKKVKNEAEAPVAEASPLEDSRHNPAYGASEPWQPDTQVWAGEQ